MRSEAPPLPKLSMKIQVISPWRRQKDCFLSYRFRWMNLPRPETRNLSLACFESRNSDMTSRHPPSAARAFRKIGGEHAVSSSSEIIRGSKCTWSGRLVDIDCTHLMKLGTAIPNKSKGLLRAPRRSTGPPEPCARREAATVSCAAAASRLSAGAWWSVLPNCQLMISPFLPRFQLSASCEAFASPTVPSFARPTGSWRMTSLSEPNATRAANAGVSGCSSFVVTASKHRPVVMSTSPGPKRSAC
mmetsp:Transcript_71647/g.213834  ORF Transcript_71647/g.213834 Transcript_71647/m.213834 type:complete len:245 (+) Transcript_71647:370-1104(+)